MSNDHEKFWESVSSMRQEQNRRSQQEQQSWQQQAQSQADSFWSESPFESFYQKYSGFTSSYRYTISEVDKPIFEQCKKDAIEYFYSSLGIPLSTKTVRINISREQKERVYAFLKNRKNIMKRMDY